jgi:hypothetical protein
MSKNNAVAKKEDQATPKFSLDTLRTFVLKEGEKINWDDIAGETYGGSSNYLKLEVGQADGPFAFVRIDEGIRLTEESQPIDIPVAVRGDGKEIRMPASAVFRKNFEEAEVEEGEVFFVMRMPDAIKKTGTKAQGKGITMEVYSIKFPGR